MLQACPGSGKTGVFLLPMMNQTGKTRPACQKKILPDDRQPSPAKGLLVVLIAISFIGTS